MAVLSFILVFVVAFLLIPPNSTLLYSAEIIDFKIVHNNLAPEPNTEVIEKRDARSKTTYLGNGRYALDVSMAPVHYDVDGTWQNIDNQFTPATTPWDWQMVNDSYQTFVLNDFTAGQVLKFQANGESVAFQPMALEWTNDIDQIQQVSMPQDVVSAVSNPIVNLLPDTPDGMGKIQWYDGYGEGINFSWQNTPGRLSKLLEIESLSNLPAPPAYIISGGNPALRLNFIFEPSKDLDIYVNGQIWDKKNNINTINAVEFKSGDDFLWGFLPAKYWDSGTDYIPPGIMQLRKSGISLYVSVLVPYSWIQTATYPVYIDPTIDPNPEIDASTDDAHEKESDGAMDLTAVGAACYASAADVSRLWLGLRFVSAEFPAAGAEITSCYIDQQCDATAVDDIDGFIYFQLATSPLTFSSDDFDITSRDITDESVAWDVDSLGVGRTQTPSLVTPAQELWDTYSPTAVVSIWEPNTVETKSFRTAAYDRSTSTVPQLHLEWEGFVGNMTTLATWTAGTGEQARSIHYFDGYLYAGIYSESPGIVYKIDPSTNVTMGTWTGETGQNQAISLCDDGTYLYVGLHTNPGIVVQIDTDTMTTVDSYTAPYAYARGLYSDGNYVFSTIQGGNRAIKINTSNMSALATWTGNATQHNPAGITGDGTYLYLACSYEQPGVVVKVQMSDMATADEWVGDGDASENYTNSICVAGDFVYVGLGDYLVSEFTAGVVKINKADMTTNSTWFGGGGQYNCLAVDVDDEGEYIYAGLATHADNQTILKISTSDMTTSDNWTGKVTTNGCWSLDYYNGIVYAETYDGVGEGEVTTIMTGIPIVMAQKKAFGVIKVNSINWSKGSEPSWPLTDGDALFYIYNNGTVNIDISANATNPAGGAGATLTSGTPGNDEIYVCLLKEGDNLSDNLTLTTAQQSWMTNIAASANVSWEIRLETGSTTENPPTGKTFHIYILVTAS